MVRSTHYIYTVSGLCPDQFPHQGFNIPLFSLKLTSLVKLFHCNNGYIGAHCTEVDLKALMPEKGNDYIRASTGIQE